MRVDEIIDGVVETSQAQVRVLAQVPRVVNAIVREQVSPARSPIQPNPGHVDVAAQIRNGPDVNARALVRERRLVDDGAAVHMDERQVVARWAARLCLRALDAREQEQSDCADN
jgi:hypothetical protein